jgi:hypothetical protein
MVTFVSLFLWLMTNTHPVQVAVDPDVASVELFLDGRSIGTVDSAPWEVMCDFGPTLQPHELEAVARCEDGTELGRAKQLVNLPRPAAEVQVILETGPSGSPEGIRVVSESGERLQPIAVFATFDGLTLTRRRDFRFDLPPYDPKQIHIVSAEAHFPGDLVARQDVTFGGTYGSKVATELTAVPVFAAESNRVRVEDVQGYFSVRGVPAQVAAVEQPGARVFMIRDSGAWPRMRRMGQQSDQRSRTLSRRAMRQFRDASRDSNPTELPSDADVFHMVLPSPTHSRGLMLFPVGQALDIERWGLPWMATHLTDIGASGIGQRLADAVAVAGVRAAGDGRPRTVVLVLSGNPIDGGGYTPSAVREYLRVLRVPLTVWSIDGVAEGPWGAASDISNLAKLNRASRDLMLDLDRQWVVWIEGRHLPNTIELASNPAGLRLAQ